MARKPAGLGLVEAARPRASSETRADSLHPNRVGKKMLCGWFDRAAVKQFQQMRLDRETTTQELLGEALNLLFQAYDKPPVAWISEKADR